VINKNYNQSSTNTHVDLKFFNLFNNKEKKMTHCDPFLNPKKFRKNIHVNLCQKEHHGKFNILVLNNYFILNFSCQKRMFHDLKFIKKLFLKFYSLKNLVLKILTFTEINIISVELAMVLPTYLLWHLKYHDVWLVHRFPFPPYIIKHS